MNAANAFRRCLDDPGLAARRTIKGKGTFHAEPLFGRMQWWQITRSNGVVRWVPVSDIAIQRILMSREARSHWEVISVAKAEE